MTTMDTWPRGPGLDADCGNLQSRVLIVDDEVAMARAMNRVLRRAGFECLFASSGLQVRSLLCTFKPALLTLDIQMPWIDGMDVLQLLRDSPRNRPFKILVVSAAPRPERALAAGADAVLAKPFTNQELVDTVLAQFGTLGRDPVCKVSRSS
ncbi:MAG: response regulator [Burkholderiales bacterium]|jgi:two-component system, OmpR family, response regulator VicR|nr:response regulator [Burkholderiales bacterium]